MSATTTDQSLTQLNQKILRKQAEASALGIAADDLVHKLTTEGKSPLTDKDAHAKVDAAYTAAETARDQLEALRQERDKIAEHAGRAARAGVSFGAGQRFDDGAVLGSSPWTLDRQGLDTLIEAARGKHSARVGGGVNAAVTWSDPISIDRTAIVDLIAQEPTRISDLIPGLATTASRVEFTKQTAQADQAASVAQGAPKPQSSPGFERDSVDVTKVAHYGSIDDEILKDDSRARELVGRAFILGLISEENRELLVGDGTGEDLVGLLETDGILHVSRNGTTSEFRLEAVHRAKTALRNVSFAEASVIVMNPADYEIALFEKASGSGEYLAGNPLSGDTSKLWGTPVVLTTDMPEHTAMVANLPLAARIHWREAPVFEVHPYGGGETQWVHNQTLVRAEERLALSVHHPAMIVEVGNL